jgi:hypothetical protein
MPLVVNRKCCDEVSERPVVLLSWCFSHTLILYSVTGTLGRHLVNFAALSLRQICPKL